MGFREGIKNSFMKKVKAEISGRHLHLSHADMETLFGEGYELKVLKDLSQPGEFATEEKVEVIGPKNKIMMRIVGPTRGQTQVELAMTDARFLGVEAVIRVSGDLEGTPGGLKLKGPKGELELETGVIVPQRHLHCSAEDAEKWGLKTGDKVKAIVRGERALVFDEIIVRAGEKYATDIHIDTDEANAAGLRTCSYVELDIK